HASSIQLPSWWSTDHTDEPRLLSLGSSNFILVLVLALLFGLLAGAFLGGASHGAVALLTAHVGLEAGGLTAEVAQVVELGAPAAAAPYHRDAVDQWGVDGEHALHALPERNLAHGDGAAGTLAVLAGNDDAFEGLDAAPV